MHEPGAHADHVGDRVERTDLVEVHLVGRGAVYGGLGDCEALEDAVRAFGHRGSEVGAGQQRPHVGPGAVRRRLGELHVAPRRGQPAAADLLDREPDRLRRHRIDGRLQDLGRDSGADQCPEQHVAGGSGARVDPADHARLARRAIRAAATPAP